jgi:septal ring factor EnvC (AmiA/AmiB activator)
MRYLLLTMLLIIGTPSYAQDTAPSPQSIKKVEKKITQTKQEKEKLKKKLKTIKNDLSASRKDLISLAKEIKKNEQNLIGLELSIRAKQQEQENIENKLTEDKKSISDLILALERIRRIPPEAIFARPETPLKTAQSSMLLQNILPRIYNRADLLKEDLARLHAIVEGLEKDKSEALKLSVKLQDNQKKLSQALSKREAIYANTEKDIKNKDTKLSKISAQARNLKDLVKKLEQRQKAENAKKAKSPPIPGFGKGQLPVGGRILVGYGKTDNIGAVSQGLKIQTRPNALIVAPMGGIIDYAGKFKGYGQIIIIKHQKNYHSLIAGLSDINTVVGRNVSAGEPIGKMASSSGNNGIQSLYYELRYKGSPVNPSKKITGLR